MNARVYATALALSLTLGTGCFSTTRIVSEPSNAMVVMNNRSLGNTPVELEEMVWLWTRHSVTVRKEGFAPQTIEIRNQGLNFGYAAVCVCTGGLLLPFLFTSTYPNQYVVKLAPETPTSESASYVERPSIRFAE